MVKNNRRNKGRRDWITQLAAVLAGTEFFYRIGKWASQVVTTAELLEIDPDHDSLKDRTVEQLAAAAEVIRAKRKMQQALEGAPKLHAQVVSAFLSPSLSQHRGRPNETQYDVAFSRRIAGVCRTYREAYNLMIQEMDEPDKSHFRSDASAYADGFQAFKSAMRRRRQRWNIE